MTDKTGPAYAAGGPIHRQALRALIVDDSETDCELILAHLRAGGFDVDYLRVDTREALRAQLDTNWDVILCDFLMPAGFTALEAYRAVQERSIETPFIIVSGVIDVRTAVRAVQDGVADFVMKDRMETLALDVSRALELRVGVWAKTELQTIKRQLLIASNHEIRLPLTLVIGYGFILKEMLDPAVPGHADLLDVLSRLLKGAARLLALLDNVMLINELMYSAARQEYLNDRVAFNDWNGLVLATIERLRDELARKGFGVKVSIAEHLPAVLVCEAQMKVVVHRLIENAIKFTVKGSVTVEIAAESGGVALRVIDTGIGIPANETPFVFEAFKQVRRENHEQQGLGVGLALVKGYVEIHRGQIFVESQVGKGTTFTVRLPQLSAD